MEWMRVGAMILVLLLVWSLFLRHIFALAWPVIKIAFNCVQELLKLLVKGLKMLNRKTQTREVTNGKPSVMIQGDAIHLN